MAKQIGKRLVADVFDMAFFQDDKVAITSESLTDSGIDFDVQEKEINGGKGNGRIATLHSNRKVNIKATDPVFDFNLLALNLGQTIKTGAGIGYCMKQKLKIVLNTSNKEITLAEKPKDNKKPECYFKGALITDSKITLTEKVLKIADDAIAEGDFIEVMPYVFTTPATSETISITSNTYAKAGRLVLETLEIDTDERPTAKLQYIFHSASPSGKFSINTKSEKDASPTTLEFSANQPLDANEIGYIVRIPIERSV